jgi:hypothetical protein
MLTSLLTRLAAKTHLADGEILQVTLNRKGFLKLQEVTQIPVVPTRAWQHFKPEQTSEE